MRDGMAHLQIQSVEFTLRKQGVFAGRLQAVVSNKVQQRLEIPQNRSWPVFIDFLVAQNLLGTLGDGETGCVFGEQDFQHDETPFLQVCCDSLLRLPGTYGVRF